MPSPRSISWDSTAIDGLAWPFSISEMYFAWMSARWPSASCVSAAASRNVRRRRATSVFLDFVRNERIRDFLTGMAHPRSRIREVQFSCYWLPMTRAEWLAIAEALRAQRAATASTWPPSGDYTPTADEAHDRKLIYFAQLDAIDRIATVLAALLDKLGGSFDVQRFLRIISSG
jgi:hypothetical protein